MSRVDNINSVRETNANLMQILARVQTQLGTMEQTAEIANILLDIQAATSETVTLETKLQRLRAVAGDDDKEDIAKWYRENFSKK